MLVFAQTVAIDIAVGKPPLLRAYQGFVHLVQKFPILVDFVQVPDRPSGQGGLTDIGFYAMRRMRDDPAIMDYIGNHAVVQLEIKHDAKLIFR